MTDSAANDPTHDRVGSWTHAAGFAVLALCVRALPLRNVFIDGQTYFTDSDSYYHLRRIAYNLASFPGTLEHDPYLNFPHGAKAIWPQTVDWLLAALIWPFHTVGEEPGYEVFLAWVPPVVGALTVCAVYWLVAKHFGRREAGAAATVLALLPAHFWYSQVGFLDHHVFVAFVAALLLGCTMSLLNACCATSSAGAALHRKSVVLGLLQAVALSIWPGALLYVALSQGSLLGLAVLGEGPGTRRRAFVGIAIASVVALVALAPLCLGNDWPQWGPFSAVVLSNFQLWWLCASALFALASMQVDARFSTADLATRAGAVAAVGILLVGLSALALPDLGASIGESAQWLGKTDSFQALVGESVPLFVLHGRFTTDIASSRLSYFVYVFPFAIAYLAWQWRSSANGAALGAFAFWAVVLFAFTLVQKRFFNTFSIALAVTFGLALVRSGDFAKARWSMSPFTATTLATVLSLLLVAPCLAVYRAELRGAGPDVDDGPSLRNLRIESNILRRAMTTWLRDHTPETTGFVESNGSPEYGVIARWGEGHFITYTAQRPAVMGNFGDDLGKDHFLLARSFFSASPERAEAILEELGVRYVVIRSMSESRAMAKALFASDGSRLDRYRLIHEVRPRAGRELASYKIFEFVAGARLEGRAQASEIVKATLDLTTNLGRKTRYEAVALSDRDGRYRLRLPYATEGVAGDLRTAPYYVIESGDLSHPVAVGESAVQQGSVVTGPDF